MTTDHHMARRQRLPSGSCLVTDVLLFHRFDVPAHHKSRTHSPPGHLVHLMLRGTLDLRIGNRHHRAKEGDAVYYFENEEVFWQGNPNSVSFYSLAFLAPQLQPLEVTQRVFPSSRDMRTAFTALNEIWSQQDRPAMLALTYAHVLFIVADLVMRQNMEAGHTESTGHIWWDVEAHLRRGRVYRTSIGALAERFKRSPATLARSCRAATGMSPGKRLRALRMEAAKGLLRYSMMTISEVADQLGYGRIHEFSREFASYVGLSPRRWRANASSPRT